MTAKKSLVGFLVLFGEISHPNHSKLAQLFYEKRRPSFDAVFDEKVEPDTYLRLEDLAEDIHQLIQAKLAPSDVHGIVCFECQDMCSSSFGERKALIFGPGCTYKTLDQVLWYDKAKQQPNRLDMALASTQKLPVAFYVKPEHAAEHLQEAVNDSNERPTS